MIISRTSTAHTMASIEPYESGQDHSEPATSPCIVLTICCEASRGTRLITQRNLSQTQLRQQRATEIQRRLVGNCSLSLLVNFATGPHTSTRSEWSHASMKVHSR